MFETNLKKIDRSYNIFSTSVYFADIKRIINQLIVHCNSNRFRYSIHRISSFYHLQFNVVIRTVNQFFITYYTFVINVL